MEQQAALQNFRGEAKKPISIPKSFQASVGPNLSITVNGIRVSIPCDGKTYYINETHWEHAKERIAKVDILNTIPDDVQEITAQTNIVKHKGKLHISLLFFICYNKIKLKELILCIL